MDPISKVKVSGTSYEVKDETARQAIVTLNNTKQDVLVSGDNIKTINSQSLLGSGDLQVSGLPAVTSSDNNKILQVVNGAWTIVMPVAIYSGTSTPNNSVGNNGDLYLQTS